MADSTAPTKTQTIVIVIGLVLGFVLALGGYITGENWLAFAGSLLGIGSGARGLATGAL